MMRRSTFQKVGGFDSKYFMYCEDMDICLQVRRLGLKVYYLPTAEIVHHGVKSSARQFNKFSTVMLRQAVLLYIQANFGRMRGLLYRMLMGVSAVVRLALILLRLPFVTSAKRSAQSASLQKWSAIFSWTLGREKWVLNYPHRSAANQKS